jgi:pyridinium-3,5-bisthiocarboxylic acid mononucleotide nickel chelatase
MTLAYFDCFSGISGDMTLGALVDAGVSPDALRSELRRLDLSGYELASGKVVRSGIAAVKVNVVVDRDGPASFRRLSDIVRLIESSSLSPSVKEKSVRIFRRLADAEAKAHGTTPDEVHFHETGATDAVVDIVGSVIGLELLNVSGIIASPINVGSGTARSEHGLLPIPAPATAELLAGIPIYQTAADFELTTPTGAAIISTLSRSFGLLPQMKIGRIAYGAGDGDFPGRPNVLRLMIGEPAQDYYMEDSAVLIETNIDDMNPQLYDHIVEKLMGAGALDAFLTPVIMKKGRPAVLLTALADRPRADALLDVIFRESTSIGVRMREVIRKKLAREIREVETPFGAIRVKVSRRGDELLSATPEYEDCKRLADEKKAPLKVVLEEAKKRI